MTKLHLTPTTMVAGGTALARDDGGRVVFVDGALPGERVVALLSEERRDFARAVVIEIIEASVDRVAPPCLALADGCGGCTWQHVTPEAQTRLKAGIITDALRRIGHLAHPPVPGFVAQADPGLRTTARLGVTASGRAGYQPRAARRPLGEAIGPVPTDFCLAAHPRLDELISSGRYPGAGRVLLRVGVASGERLVRVQGPVTDIAVPPDVTVRRDGDDRAAWVHEVVAGRRFRISADSFFQPGPAAAGALVAAVSDAVGDALPPGGQLVDAYAGVGLFASVLGAARGANVIAIEHHLPAVADARINLGDVDARIVVSDVARWRPSRRARPDVVIADPARPGLGRPGVATVVATAAPCLVLVSCDPASLARDAALLAGEGYRLSSLSMVDTFPHTFHVETVSRFDRGPGPRPQGKNEETLP